ncbi:hypothetical protein JTB14_004157 [Gonioctena quinquepunctata]|nr:hypothetical protein JTB14_004157 [Gonioctena quinquepunctata]
MKSEISNDLCTTLNKEITELKHNLNVYEFINKQFEMEMVRLIDQNNKYSEELNNMSDELQKSLDNICKTNTPSKNPLLPIKTKRTHNPECTLHTNHKIFIIANGHGRQLAKNLVQLLNNNFQIQSVIKPNASNKELLTTAIEYSSNLTKNDSVILWPNIGNKKLVNDFILKLNNTNPLIITEPYQLDMKEKLNFAIYEDNLAMYKELHKQKLSTSNIIECNSILRKSNYCSDGFTLNDNGKWHICKHLVKRTLQLISQTNRKSQRRMKETTHRTTQIIKDRPIRNEPRVSDSKQNFLDPTRTQRNKQ